MPNAVQILDWGHAVEAASSPLLDVSDRAFWTGFVIVALSVVSALATYLILTGLTPITPRDEVVLCVDAQVMGLGGASCGPGPLAYCTVKAERTEFRYILRPMLGGEDPSMEGRKPSLVAEAPRITRGDEGYLQATGPGELRLVTDSGVYDPALSFSQGGTVRAIAHAPGLVPSPEVSVTFPPQRPFTRIATGDVRVVGASSEEPGEGLAAFAVDGNPDTFWHTSWSSSEPLPPHHLILDLSRPRTLIGFEYLPRQSSSNGRVADYRLAVSADNRGWNTVAEGRFSEGAARQWVWLPTPAPARYVRFEALAEVRGRPWATVAELGFLQAPQPRAGGRHASL